MNIENEQEIIDKITAKFSTDKNAMNSIIKLYQENKSTNLSLNQSFFEKIPASVKLPDNKILNKFKGVNGKIYAEKWGVKKLENIFIAYEGEQNSYYPDGGSNGNGLWVRHTINSECVDDNEEFITP